MSLISVIVTTYNWSDALRACLDSLLVQQDQNFEILVADDGSGPETKQTIQTYQGKVISVQHIYQEDNGFQAAKIRNKAAAQSRGDYLLFIDGDCLARPDFITRHRNMAEPGRFVPGNRVLFSQSFTHEFLKHPYPIASRSIGHFIKLYGKHYINRLFPLIYLPLGPLRKIQSDKWQKAMTCNLAMFKQDFVNVNGFDELFAGWGYEDSDLVIRLIHAGIKRKEGRFAAPVLHLWHTENDKSREQQNYQRLLERIENNSLISAERGVSQYLN